MEQRVDVARGAEAERIVSLVRERYGKIAVGGRSCCGPVETACGAPEVGYTAEDLAAVPEEAQLGLGCGAPIGFLKPAPGETVLDLGSGAGIDVFLAARQVGPQGRVIGIDMTPEMLGKARANAVRLGVANAEFREGRLEALPLPDASVDAVTSNCVINLVPDKAAVFREIARVLKPGGRLVISDIVLDGRLPEAIEHDVMALVGCVAGASQRERYFELVREAGLAGIELLRDADYGGMLIETAPAEAESLLARTGTRPEDVVGKVRSVTWRAVRP